MKRLISFLVLMLILSVSPYAEPRTVVNLTMVSGAGAFAEWFITDTQGDTFTFVNVIATTSATSAPPTGPVDDTPFLAIAIEQSRISNGDLLLSGVAFTTNFVFTTDKDLKDANVQSTLIFEDNNSQTTFPMTINMNWMGIKPFSEHSHLDTRDHERVGIIENFRGQTSYGGRHRQRPGPEHRVYPGAVLNRRDPCQQERYRLNRCKLAAFAPARGNCREPLHRAALQVVSKTSSIISRYSTVVRSISRANGSFAPPNPPSLPS
jgi:hypothetical protein